MRSATAYLVLVLVFAGCLPKEEPLPPLDPKQKEGMERLRDDLRGGKQLAPGVRADIAAASLHEGENGRLPASVLKALDGIGGKGVEPDQKSTILFNGLPDELWKKTCKAPAVREELSRSMSAAEKTQRIYEKCEFARFDLVSRDDALAADPGALALGMVVYDFLVRHASLVEVERDLLAVFIKHSAEWRTPAP